MTGIVITVLFLIAATRSSKTAPGEVSTARPLVAERSFDGSSVSGAVHSGAAVTDTHISVRVTATVAPERLLGSAAPTVERSTRLVKSVTLRPQAKSLGDPSSGGIEANWSESQGGLTAPRIRESGRDSLCRSARVGLGFYRQRARDWLKLRGVRSYSAQSGNAEGGASTGLRSPRPRKPRSCPDARYLAQVAKRRSFAARQAYGRYVERRTLRDFRVTPDSNAWQKAVQEAQRAYPGTSSWLWNCSAAEGGHGRWVRFGGGSYYPGYEHTDQVGNWMQYRWSTFRGHYRHALDELHARGFHVPPDLRDPGNVRAWLSPLATALAGGWARYTGNDDSHWSASFGRGC